MMTELDYNLELAALDQSIALGELEVVKAQERVNELKYRKATDITDALRCMAKVAAQQVAAQQAHNPDVSKQPL